MLLVSKVKQIAPDLVDAIVGGEETIALVLRVCYGFRKVGMNAVYTPRVTYGLRERLADLSILD